MIRASLPCLSCLITLIPLRLTVGVDLPRKRVCSVGAKDYANKSEESIDYTVVEHGGVHLLFEAEGESNPLDSPSILYVTDVDSGKEGRRHSCSRRGSTSGSFDQDARTEHPPPFGRWSAHTCRILRLPRHAALAGSWYAQSARFASRTSPSPRARERA